MRNALLMIALTVVTATAQTPQPFDASNVRFHYDIVAGLARAK
jgi:hypothetical protein